MKKLGAIRRELYERLDRPALKPLPRERYEMWEWKTCTVNIDYHVELDNNFYSIPYQLVYEHVETRRTASVVEVWFKGKRVTSHPRLKGQGRFETKPEHMPRSHREYLDWTPSRLIHWAETMGPVTRRFIAEILKRRSHPEQGFRACMGILRLSQKFGEQRLKAACLRAEALSSYSYRTVKNILSSGSDRLKVERELDEVVHREHENIRGASYYEGREIPC